jgi:hypothetical protein
MGRGFAVVIGGGGELPAAGEGAAGMSEDEVAAGTTGSGGANVAASRMGAVFCPALAAEPDGGAVVTGTDTAAVTFAGAGPRSPSHVSNATSPTTSGTAKAA